MTDPLIVTHTPRKPRWLSKYICIIFGHTHARPDNPRICARCGHGMTIRPEVKA